MSPSDPAAPRLAARLIESLAGLDLASADGRAGIRALLSEIERLAPGAILRQAATIELDRVGWRRAPVPSLEAPRAGVSALEPHRAQAASPSSRRRPGRGASVSAPSCQE